MFHTLKRPGVRFALIGCVLGFGLAHILILIDNTSWFSSKSTFTALQHIYNNVSGYYWSTEINREVENQTKSGNVRVLCWVQTHPANHRKKAIHVKNTWGKRCDKLLFMSVENDTELPTVKLEGFGPEKKWLWGRHNAAFKYVYDHHFDDADWFMKADEDTYVVVENLKLMLSSKNTSDPVWFGCRFKTFMSGGSGYVLSKEALRRFIEVAIPAGNEKCREDGMTKFDDVEMARCLKNVGVVPGESRDEDGRYRFLPLPLERFFNSSEEGYYAWYWKALVYPQKKGMNCCSDKIVAFHYVTPLQLYVMEYLIYHVNPVNALSNNMLSSSTGVIPSKGLT